MATVVDKSGNGFAPGHVDFRIGGTYDVPTFKHRGAQQSIAIGAAAVLSAAFARTARNIRIAPSGDIHYEVGAAPVADANSPFLGSGAVEDVRISHHDSLPWRSHKILTCVCGWITLGYHLFHLGVDLIVIGVIQGEACGGAKLIRI